MAVLREWRAEIRRELKEEYVRYVVETGIAHLGNSSLRLMHRMIHARTGAVVAQLGQFGVNLDLDARRPARWADDVRARAVALLVV